MTKYVLPDLSYDYSALEPHLSAKVMELHHDSHHRKYVEGANQALEQLHEARRKDDFLKIGTLERMLAFNVSGHLLHSVLWQNLSPNGGDQPMGELAEAIDRDFGGFDPFKKQLVHAASSILGSGWAALVWDPMARQLTTLQIHDHQSETIQGALPLMVIDAWEHAYYLQYQADKPRYLGSLWNLWDWDDIARRYELARATDLGLNGASTALPGQPTAH